MTARVTIRPGAVTWSTVKPPLEPVSVVIGGVRVTVEPVDAGKDQRAGSGGEEAAWDRLIAARAER